MSFPDSLNSHCTDKTVYKIGQDMRGIVPYRFNNFGFRADIDYDVKEKNAGCFFGMAFCSAIGIEWHNSYPYLTCKNLTSNQEVKCYNFSQGCAGVDNEEIIRTILEVKNMKEFKPKFYVIQFCDLDRRFNRTNLQLALESDKKKNVEHFVKIFLQLETSLLNENWLFFGTDFINRHELPEYITNHKNCLIWNPAIFFDQILYGMPGEKWHKMMSYGITNKLKELYF